MAQSRHVELHCTCPLLRAKRTSLFAVRKSAFDPKRTCHSRRESLRCRVSSAQSGTSTRFLVCSAKALSLAWNKNSVACVWPQIIHNIEETPNAHTPNRWPARFGDACSRTCTNQSSACFAALLPSLLRRKPMAKCGDHRNSSASTSTTIRTRSLAPSAKFCSTSLARLISL